MQTFSASDAKNRLGAVLDAAQRAPVGIEKQGRPFAVVLSQEAYQILEDAYWRLEAKKGKDSGFLSHKDSEKLLDRLRSKAKNVKP